MPAVAPGPRNTTRIRVWVQPRAGRTELRGKQGDTVKLHVAAPPVDGAANEAVVRFLAERLGLGRSAVKIVAGHKSRRKTVEIAGLDPVTVTGLLDLGR